MNECAVLETAKGAVARQIRLHEEIVAAQKDVQRRLAKVRQPNQLSYRVEITGLRANAFTAKTVRGSLEKAMASAISAFKTAHRCDDVQGTYRVFAILPGQPHAEIELPETCWT